MPIFIDGENIIIDGVIKDVENVSDFNFNQKLQARQGNGITIDTFGIISSSLGSGESIDYTQNITPPPGTTNGVTSSYITDYVERMYPPIHNFTSNSLTITGQVYGNGIYNVTSSSSHTSQYAVWKLFTPEETSGSTAWASQQNGSYNASGVYTVTNSTRTFDNIYYGEWVKIELPFSIIATKMGIERYSGYGSAAPKSFKIYGSNDNNTWTNIYTQTNTTYNLNNVIEFNILGSSSFKYFVINIVAGNMGFVSFNEWFIYGKKTISLTDNSYFLNYSDIGGWAINNLSENTLIQSLVSRIEALEG